MISVDLAQRLRLLGLLWAPIGGDRFVVPDRGMDDEAYVLSDMTVEVHDLPTGRIIGFNGTTEWALDSLDVHEVVWLPRESQLRELLAARFVRLEVVEDGFAVIITGAAGAPGAAGAVDADAAMDQRHVGIDAEDAYARALVAVLEESFD